MNVYDDSDVPDGAVALLQSCYMLVPGVSCCAACVPHLSSYRATRTVSPPFWLDFQPDSSQLALGVWGLGKYLCSSALVATIQQLRTASGPQEPV